MNKSPLIVIVIAFIAGILVSRYTDIPFIIFWMSALLFLILSSIFIKSKIKFILFIIFSIIFLGSVAFRNCENLPSNHIFNFTPYKGSTVLIEGVIDNDPIVKAKASMFIIKAEKLIKDNKEHKVCRKVFVKVFGKKSFLYGDKLRIEGKLYRVPYFRISSKLNYRDHLKSQGIYSILSAGRQSTVKLLDRNQGNPLKSFAFRIRQRIKRMIARDMSPPLASLLGAIIIGERSDLPNTLRNIMVQSGTVHIIAISGLHVGLVSFIVLMVLKIIRIPRRLCYIIAAGILIVYCILTGARTPVVRVTIIALILFLGHIIGRQTNLYNSLSAAALIILLYNPLQLFNVSFQLSFLSVLSIVGFSPLIKDLLFAREDLFTKSYLRILIKLFCGSLAAWIGLFPIIAYYFNIISPIAILANMVVVPYLSIIVGSGILAILIGFTFPPFACIFFAASEASIAFLIKFVALLRGIPGAYFYVPNISFRFVALYYLFLAIFLLIKGLKNNQLFSFNIRPGNKST